VQSIGSISAAIEEFEPSVCSRMCPAGHLTIQTVRSIVVTLLFALAFHTWPGETAVLISYPAEFYGKVVAGSFSCVSCDSWIIGSKKNTIH
ncbi:MAG TPA: hypothetical protein VGP85_25650, partial [Pyrinomonadaceae bacterium]|nr:hypothetical protein [Pyrinomonadaceae bacterium]